MNLIELFNQIITMDIQLLATRFVAICIGLIIILFILGIIMDYAHYIRHVYKRCDD